jgi:hypothetical protein
MLFRRLHANAEISESAHDILMSNGRSLEDEADAEHKDDTCAMITSRRL